MTNGKEMDRGKTAREKLIIRSPLGFVSPERFPLATYREKFHVERDSTVPEQLSGDQKNSVPNGTEKKWKFQKYLCT